MARAPAEVLEDPNAAPTTGYAAPLMRGGFGGLFTLPPTRPCANVAYQVGKTTVDERSRQDFKCLRCFRGGQQPQR